MMREKTKIKIKNELKELFREDTEAADRIFRLITGNSTEEEKKRWQEVGVMNSEGFVILEPRTGPKKLGITLCLFEACYNGWLQRCDK